MVLLLSAFCRNIEERVPAEKSSPAGKKLYRLSSEVLFWSRWSKKAEELAI